MFCKKKHIARKTEGKRYRTILMFTFTLLLNWGTISSFFIEFIKTLKKYAFKYIKDGWTQNTLIVWDTCADIMGYYLLCKWISVLINFPLRSFLFLYILFLFVTHVPIILKIRKSLSRLIFRILTLLCAGQVRD